MQWISEHVPANRHSAKSPAQIRSWAPRARSCWRQSKVRLLRTYLADRNMQVVLGCPQHLLDQPHPLDDSRELGSWFVFFVS